MPHRLALLVSLLGWGLLTPPAQAAQPLTLCDWRTPERYAPQRLASRVRAAADAGPTPDLVTALRALLAHPCLALAAHELDEAVPDSPHAVLDWFERGGARWLRHVVHGGGGARFKRSPRTRMLVLPPSFRPWLDGAQLAPDHPLKAITCPSVDPQCGQATRGWRRRRDQVNQQTLSLCSSAASYRAFLHCVHTHLPEGAVNPGGRFRRPDRGQFQWMRLGGGAEAWTIDLATGAATRLVLPGLAARHEGERPRLEVGTVPRDNLHEAVLALLLSSQREPVPRAHLYRVPVPDVPLQIDPAAAPEPKAESSGGFGLTGKRPRTRWRFLPDGAQVAAEAPLDVPAQRDGDRIVPHHDAEALFETARLGFETTRRVPLNPTQREALYHQMVADDVAGWAQALHHLAQGAKPSAKQPPAQ